MIYLFVIFNISWKEKLKTDNTLNITAINKPQSCFLLNNAAFSNTVFTFFLPKTKGKSLIFVILPHNVYLFPRDFFFAKQEKND